MTQKKGVMENLARCLCLMAVIVSQILGDRKYTNVSLKQILGWADNASTQDSKTIRRLSLKQIEDGVKSRGHSVVSEAEGACVHRVIQACDLRPMAKLLMIDDSPCTLLKEYQFCIDRESASCKTGGVRLLRSSLTQLVLGLQANGHCANVRVKSDGTATPRKTAKLEKPCATKAAWICTVSLVEDIKVDHVNVCTTLANFRHCIHTETAHCSHHAARMLQRGSKGLSRIYRRNTLECPVTPKRHTNGRRQSAHG